ncbi:hypothetical protein AKJ16_DCAP00609, partial [Drosera capensis]
MVIQPRLHSHHEVDDPIRLTLRISQPLTQYMQVTQRRTITSEIRYRHLRHGDHLAATISIARPVQHFQAFIAWYAAVASALTLTNVLFFTGLLLPILRSSTETIVMSNLNADEHEE